MRVMSDELSSRTGILLPKHSDPRPYTAHCDLLEKGKEEGGEGEEKGEEEEEEEEEEAAAAAEANFKDDGEGS